MLRFPINWRIPRTHKSVRGADQVVSELTLNEEWEIACLRRNNEDHRTFEISRKTPSKQVLVTGTILLLQNERELLIRDFFILMEPGSSSENLFVFNSIADGSELNDLDIEYYFPCNLSGTIYITSLSELCTSCLPLVELTKDFVKLLDPQTSYFLDVNLKCGDVLIPAHKSILSARSTVFAAMFANEMKENRRNQVDIVDIEPSVVREMLIYMYTGRTSSLTVSLASGLLLAADKYHLANLKKVCSDFLKVNINIENAMSILVLGDLHAEDLKSFAEDFICNKCPDFSVFEKTEDWKIMRKEKPHLTVDILTSLMKLKNKIPDVNGGSTKSRNWKRKFPSVKNLFKSGIFHRFV